MSSRPRSAEMHPGPGFRVKLDFERCEPETIQGLGKFPTPDISDQLNRLYAVDSSIRLMTADHHALCGPALTVKVFPGDNLMVHKALDVAKPGDVVVVDAGGSQGNAVLGDIICRKAKHRQIAGFIIDGLIRDVPEILPLDFPVFAQGTTAIGPLHRGPGEINFPICCGGVVTNPGDIVVADSAGVVIVPQEVALELLQKLKSNQARMETYVQAVDRGEFSNDWVDGVLRENNCPVIHPVDRPRTVPAQPTLEKDVINT
ncbi:MAG: RraA family protein [Planctomycetota bacterium]|nr:MAG: RraA family protein [Planctomycetota bacterium]REK29481.1 MAG: RraA family protein [Planctomycetota bacterium]REK31846.1 MAG: RraA family protein [Planctomycetota bacterium]